MLAFRTYRRAKRPAKGRRRCWPKRMHCKKKPKRTILVSTATKRVVQELCERERGSTRERDKDSDRAALAGDRDWEALSALRIANGVGFAALWFMHLVSKFDASACTSLIRRVCLVCWPWKATTVANKKTKLKLALLTFGQLAVALELV